MANYAKRVALSKIFACLEKTTLWNDMLGMRTEIKLF
nr:MAG TPA: hypothetical protein [Caudoviricetes sp.]